jgi:crotonobetainyl-CoA:carnitine CoA-transferase CaiB-like acyl-CoA transferase
VDGLRRLLHRLRRLAPPASGAHHASIAPYGPFRAGDGEVVYVAVQKRREWARFCADVLDRPELADDTRFSDNAARVRHRTALHEIIHEAFAGCQQSRSSTASIARTSPCAHEFVAGFLEHSAAVRSTRWADDRLAAGPLRAWLPGPIDGVDPHLGDVSALGQHTDAILDELGIDAATIASWRTEGTI